MRSANPTLTPASHGRAPSGAKSLLLNTGG